jgi:radical SAM superfamily enzyme YgiQ (UPF0313 family)
MSLILDKTMGLQHDRTHSIDVLFVYPLPSLFSPERFVALSILYPNSACEDAGYKTEVHDCRFEKDDVLWKKIEQSKVVAFSTMSGTQLSETLRISENVRKINPFARVVWGGVHPTVVKEQCFDEPCVDYVILSEGEARIVALMDHIFKEKNILEIDGIGFRAKSDAGIMAVIRTDESGQTHRDNPFGIEFKSGTDHGGWIIQEAKENFDLEGSYHSPITAKTEKYFGVSVPMLPSRRGCPYRCLSGDTKVTTVFGEISIEELAKNYTDVPVYTYDREKKEVVIAKATNIRKYGENEELVRVHFTDETWVDCTPDHKFLTFSGKRENEVEARDLKPNQRIKAIRFEKAGKGYTSVTWARRDREYVHRLILEYKLSRKLEKGEIAHHWDHNKSNNHPDNIQLTTYSGHFNDFHPEIKKRMQENNPAKNMTQEWKDKIKKGVTGLKRSPESIERYRQSRMRAKNPNWKPELHEGNEVNHKVSYVEKLVEKQDVYCLTVEGYGWFFVNNVLVKNCSFCSVPQQYISRSSRPVPLDQWKGDVARMIELWEAHGNPRIKTFELNDENSLSPGAMEPYVRWMWETYGIGTHLHIRADQLRVKKNVERFKEMGVQKVHIGMESGSPRVLKNVMLKDANPETYREVAKILAEVGIYAVYTAIIGNPTETVAERNETLALLDELHEIHAASVGSRATVYTLIPLPGTSIMDICRREGWDIPNTTRGWSQVSAASNPTSKIGANVYWISGLYFNKGRGGKTDRNFGRWKFLIWPLEKLAIWRHRRRFYDFFDLEKWCIEKLIAWRSRVGGNQETEIVMSESLSGDVLSGRGSGGW